LSTSKVDKLGNLWYSGKDMPGRKVPLVNDHFYHVYNRGISHIPVFITKKDYTRFIDLLGYYRLAPPLPTFSKLKRIDRNERETLFKSLRKKKRKLVDVLCFCLMPNHFHLLLRQNQKGGISKFLSQIQNGYTKYFNIKNKRSGPIFQSKFKSVLIETEEQLLHLSRYIHLNPYSSAIVDSFQKLKDYPWSSLPHYLSSGNLHNQFCQKEVVMSYFKNENEYEKFILDRADYQKELEYIKHLLLE
jgi:putative transposase